MNPYARQCVELAARALEQPEEAVALLLVSPPDLAKGDYALPCFQLAKQLRRPPPQIAAEAASRIQPTGLVTRVEAAGGYLNFFIDRARERAEVLARIQAEGERYGNSATGRGERVVIDYSSPNIAKPFHIGHMRSTIIGAALYRIHAALGYQPVGINHLGDWGTQFGNLLAGYELWGDEAKLQSDPLEHLLWLYTHFHQQADEREAEIGKGTRPAAESLYAAGRERFRRLEAGDPAMRALWQRFRDLSLEKFEKVYELLGIRFDHYAGESVYEPVLEQTIAWAESAGITRVSEGALIVPFPEGEGLAPGILKKSDGATTYLTRDLAAVRERWERWKPAKLLYVVGAPQRDHFRQLFRLLELAGLEWAGRCHHVSFGHVEGLSTRKGHVIHLEEVLARAASEVAGVIAEKNPELKRRDEVSRAVGIGAVVFHDMRAARIKDIKFEWKEVLSFEGETGPYVMWNHARSASILKKSGRPAGSPPAGDPALLDTPEDLAVVRALARFPDEVERAAAELEPSILARYLLALSSTWSAYLYKHRVLEARSPALVEARLGLVAAVRTVLARGLGLLGLAAPEEM